MFEGFQAHSVLYVLHASTSLADLDPKEVVEMLKRRPLLAVSSTVSSPTKVYGHLVPASPTKTIASPLKAGGGLSRVLARSSSLAALTTAISTEQERDLAVFYSFCAVKEFMAVLAMGLDLHAVPADTLSLLSKLRLNIQHCSQMKPTELEAAMSQKLSQAKEYLTLVYPLNYRLEVLEDIFSLLFVRGVDLSLPGADDSSSSATDEPGQPRNPKDVRASGSSTTAFDAATAQAIGGGGQAFIVTDTVARQLLSVLKDCLISLTSAKFAQLSTSASGTGGDSAAEHGEDLVHTSVPMDSLQTRISRLDQWINEAKWRLALVVGGPLTVVSQTTLSSSSDESSMSEVEISSSDSDEDAGEPRRRQKRLRRRRPLSRASPSSGSRETTPKDEVLRKQVGRPVPSGPTDEPDGPSKPRQSKHRLRLRSSVGARRHGHRLVGIVPQMLATPESLLHTCLRHHRFERAREVIKMFSLEGKDCAQEVIFAERLLTSRERLIAVGRSGSAARKPVTQSIASSIHASSQRPALSTSHGRQASTMVNELLSSSAMPASVGKLKQTRSTVVSESRQRWQKLLNAMLPSLVIMDLVTTCNMDRSISNQLLSLALERGQQAEPSEVQRIKSVRVSPGSGGGRPRSRAGGAVRECSLTNPFQLLQRWQRLVNSDSYISLSSLLSTATGSQVPGVEAVHKLVKLITSRSLHQLLAAGMEPLSSQTLLNQLQVGMLGLIRNSNVKIGTWGMK